MQVLWSERQEYGGKAVGIQILDCRASCVLLYLPHTSGGFSAIVVAGEMNSARK